MGTCISQQTRPGGKPEEDREQPDSYSNTATYFISQIVALITHESYEISSNVTETLLLTHIFYANSTDLLSAIRDRFFITYERYTFTTYQRECDTIYNTSSTHPNIPNTSTPSTPHPYTISDSVSISNPINVTPISDEMDLKIDLNEYHRVSSDDLGREYISTKKLEFKQWVIDVKMVIQRKCLNLLVQWIQDYWIQDFDQNEEIMQILTVFISDIKKSRDQYEDIMHDKATKKRRRKKSNQNGQNRLYNTYAAFLIPYIFKLDNIMATQQSWYRPIVEKLKTKQEEEQKLYNAQVQERKKHKHNRLNSKMNTKTTHHRTYSNSISTFSDKLFNDLYIADDSDDDDNNEDIDGINDGLNVCKMLEFVCIKNQENAEEYAAQLTLLDWELFIMIDGRICLYKILQSAQKEKWLSLKVLIDRFQETHQYVIVSIIAAPELRARIQMIEFFIFVAETLLDLNNLYSFMAVMTALDSVSVQKLKISWHLMDPYSHNQYMDVLLPLCSASNNYKVLRDYAQLMKAPAIPFLALLLKDLTFTNDANKDRLDEINFTKYMLFYRILSENVNIFHSKTYSNKLRHEKEFESSDINSLVQQLSVYEYEDDTHADNVDIIADFELQQNILSDFNSYILLNQKVIRAMTVDANRVDSLQKEEYVSQYLKVDKGTRGRTISKAIRKLFKASQHTNSKSLQSLTE